MIKRYRSKFPKLQIGEISFVDGYFETGDEYLQSVIESSEMYKNYFIVLEGMVAGRGRSSSAVDAEDGELTADKLRYIKRNIAVLDKPSTIAIARRLGLEVSDETKLKDLRQMLSAKISEVLSVEAQDSEQQAPSEQLAPEEEQQ